MGGFWEELVLLGGFDSGFCWLCLESLLSSAINSFDFNSLPLSAMFIGKNI